MADNISVLNSTGGTFTIRMTDVGGGILANNSIPTSTSGAPMSVQAGATVVSTAQGAAVVVISSLSPTHLVTLSSASQVTLTSATVTLSSNPTVIPSSVWNVTLSSNPTITSVTSGSFALINGANTAVVKAGNTLASSADAALVVQISPLSVNPNGQQPSSNSSPVVISSNQTAYPVYISSGTVTLSSNPTVILSSVASVAPSTAIGLTISSVILSTTTNATLVSSVPSQLCKVEGFNNSTTPVFVKMYNLSSTPTAGTTSVFNRYMIPTNGFISTTDIGDLYTTGLSYTVTAGIASSDTTAVPASSTYLFNLHYR